ncbi:alpha/beta hydrolase [Schaalia meyeri]|uniref:alpha/beta hydrolase n=1 Tax=Schaalia meyeri TaxID=52773 RepID=UPI0009E527B7|nr:alpha/beta-hydrolase family protein [Schaalia meyeri]
MGVMGWSFLGVIAALAMYAVSVAPSLMARSWEWHAIASGVLVTCGYVGGVIVQNVGTRVIRVTGLTISASEPVELGFRVGIAALFAVWWLYAVIQSYRRARKASKLVNMPGENLGEYLLGAAGSVVVAWCLLAIVEAFIQVGRMLIAALAAYMIRPAAVVVGVAIVCVIVFFLTSNVILRGGIGFFRHHAEQMNTRTARGIYRPFVLERSASASSPVTWESVGGQGRVFLGRGPSRLDIAQVSGKAAKEPIRVYAGMPTGGSGIEQAASTVVAELHRTGAFDRAVILLAASTGSGWVDEWQVQPLEFLTRGDCATASLQYSYVPSALNWLTGLEPSQKASAVLFRAVRAELDSMDRADRPALFVCGESLGAFASQSVFSCANDALESVDGALWVGTPAFTPMHATLTAARHKGSPEVAPVVDNARRVRFVNEPSDLRTDLYGRELGPWGFPRLVYAQHPSDPVVWWNKKLIWTQPDWLRERAGRDVSRDVEFTRFVTFIQVLADLPVAGTAPGGHGHTYHEELIPLWRAILGFDRLFDEEPAHPRLADLDGSWVDEAMVERIGIVVRANLELSDRQ